jgi:tripeptide aminopeptidase
MRSTDTHPSHFLLTMNIINRFLKYVAFDTQSCERMHTTPSTPGQLHFAEALSEELKTIGLQDVSFNSNGYVMATLPPSSPRKETVPVIGFIAHLDTSPDLPGKDVKPRIVRYTGGDIVLNEAQQIILSPDTFPKLNHYTGQELVVTDGTTLLGADDKAGIAAIVSAMQYLTEHPEIEHGKVRIAFTPDEEIGRGTDLFDVQEFGCDWAYTVDGGEVGEIEYENFNAAAVAVTVRGRNVHPGYAKGKMVNALLVGMELNNALPQTQRPEHTGGYEGFFHLTHFAGTVEEARLSYIIRDHDRTLFEERKQRMQSLAKALNRKYPGCLTVEINDQYYNMSEILKTRMEIVTLACEAMKATGVTPRMVPTRGGTDGARLSFAGLPCPNLFAGGLNFHSRYEFLPVQSLEKSMNTIIQIIKTV